MFLLNLKSLDNVVVIGSNTAGASYITNVINTFLLISRVKVSLGLRLNIKCNDPHLHDLLIDIKEVLNEMWHQVFASKNKRNHFVEHQRIRFIADVSRFKAVGNKSLMMRGLFFDFKSY